MFITGLLPEAMAKKTKKSKTLPPPPPLPKIALEPMVQRLLEPVAVVHAGDKSARLFIVELHGTIRIWKEGTLYSKPFLDIGNKIISGREMGLLGLAFHPNFKANRRLFIHYTSPVGGLHTVISEFKVGRNPDEVFPDSERVLLKVPQPYANHKGGHIAFGADGFLYIGIGDGGSIYDPHGHGQDASSLLGKILRIDVDEGATYGIPPGNPFIGHEGALPEIWALGLRNPWRLSIDTVSGLLYVGDTGENDREEINVIRKGNNYGWNIMEGKICAPGVDPKCKKEGLTEPIYDYPRSEGASVIGGYVYRGAALPELRGVYFYGDLVSGRIWGLRTNGKTITEQMLLLESGRSISAFGMDEQKELYLADLSGEILKIIPPIQELH